MPVNQISPFEYVSILVSIILGLGITQILSSFADLLYHYKKIKFYWPHTLWVVFILFLLIQDWFITYEMRDKALWRLPELLFILSYPITLFTVAKMLLPTNDKEEQTDMKKFYNSQFPGIFLITSVSIVISILFNIWLLHKPLAGQTHLVVFLAIMLYLVIKKNSNELLHQALAIVVFLAAIVSIIIEKDVWVIQ
jgi:hypothetical protein